jgi:hypothetical protein
MPSGAPSATATPAGSDVVALSAPAETFLVDNGPHKVGVIGSVTRPFCAACDRVRLTADGQIRNCLFASDESDLRTPPRAGADDDQLAAIWHGRSPPSCPGTASTITASCSPPGRCQPSAADRAAIRAARRGDRTARSGWPMSGRNHEPPSRA